MLRNFRQEASNAHAFDGSVARASNESAPAAVAASDNGAGVCERCYWIVGADIGLWGLLLDGCCCDAEGGEGGEMR
jgi:hypothetical protein